MESDLVKVGEIVGEKWMISEVLGRGTYGEVYKAIDTESGLDAAIKLENKLRKRQYLHMEKQILETVSSDQFCKMYCSGSTVTYYYICMELLGKSLGTIVVESGGTLSTCQGLGYLRQMANALSQLHMAGFVHRDVKPDNFALGLANDTVYLIDFGLSRKFMDTNGKLIPPRPIVSFQGTLTYASVNAHNKVELGRHDDLWSLLYIAVHCLTGNLPWADIEDRVTIGKMKSECDMEVLLSDSKLPPTLKEFFEHLSTLSYQDTPNYSLILESLKPDDMK